VKIELAVLISDSDGSEVTWDSSF